MTSLARLAERGLHFVAPLAGDRLREAVEGPARVAGLRVEPGLVDLVLSDADGQPGALPLVSHALTETWHRREAGLLTVDGYRAAGGIRDAVAASAERLYESLTPRSAPQLRWLMLRLVSPSESGEAYGHSCAAAATAKTSAPSAVNGLLNTAPTSATPTTASGITPQAAGRHHTRTITLCADRRRLKGFGRPTFVAQRILLGHMVPAATREPARRRPSAGRHPCNCSVAHRRLSSGHPEATQEHDSMATTDKTLSMELDRLRGILARLAFVHDSKRTAELMEQARLSIAAVRKTRASLAAKAVWSRTPLQATTAGPREHTRPRDTRDTCRCFASSFSVGGRDSVNRASL